MHDFLKRILPALPPPEFGGLAPCYYLFGIDQSGTPHPVPFSNIDDVPALCHTRLAGMNTYIAPATYKDSCFGRKASNALEVKALWLDIDVGKERNSYATLDDALAALTNFISTTGLKPTVVVHSGAGLQAYWTLTKAIPVGTWKQLAHFFASICRVQGLVIDPACTEDAARVLRMPGTTHLKSGNIARVIADKGKDWEPRVLWEAMKPLIPTDVQATTPQSAPITSPPAMQQAAAMTMPKRGLRARAEPVVRGCPCCLTAGKASEPQWFAMLGVMRSCVDGRQWAHIVSAMDPARYVPADTDAKFDRAQENMPARCATFETMAPELCAQCQHRGKLTSPIQLGLPQSQPMATVVEEAPLTPPSIDHLIIPEKYEYSLQSLNSKNFLVDERGCVHRTWKKTEDDTWEYEDQIITPARIYYSHSVYDMVDNAPRRAHWFAVETLKGRELVPFVIERDMAVQKIARWFMEANAFFANVGIKPMLLMEFMNTYLQSVLGSSQEVRTVKKFGWLTYPDPMLHTDVEGFAVGSGVVTESGMHHIHYDGVAARLAKEELSHKGDLETWKTIPQMYKTLDQKAAQLAICMAFAAPLMRYGSGMATSGVFSLWSNQSGLGKSQVMRACASIWGDPDTQFIQRHSSAVLRQRKLSTLVNLPCFMDELTDVKDEDLYSLAYTLVDGREKQKLKSSGAEMVETGTWKTITFTTANKSFKEAAARVAGDSSASILRVMEIECDFASYENQSVVHEYIHYCIGLCAQHYGVAGPEFIYQVMRHRDRLASLTPRLEAWVRERGFANQERYLSYALALSLVVGRWLVEWGLVDFDMDALEKWALGVFVPHNRSMTAANTVEHAQLLRNYLMARQLNTLVVAQHKRPDDMKPVSDDRGAPDKYIVSFPTREPRARLEVLERDLYIDLGDLTDWCLSQRLSVKVLLRELERQGIKWSYEVQSVTDGITWAFSPATKMIRLNAPNINALAVPGDTGVGKADTP